MRFFDSNCFIGLPKNGIPRPVATARELLAAMDRAGIEQALVWHVAQRDASDVLGNDLLCREVNALTPESRRRLTGCWSILPPVTNEIPAGVELFSQMAANGIKALKVFPATHRFLLREESFGGLLDDMIARRIPLMLSLEGAVTWENIYDLLREFPELVCILCDLGSWGSTRFFYPLVERYPNVYVEISDVYLDGGIEDFTEKFGAQRMLYGSGFPVQSHGGMMLALRHSEINDADKQAIAAGNLERLMQDVKL